MNLLPDISFGLDVRQPSRLETRNTADVLFGIRDGQWRDAVARVRSLPADSPEQRAAKRALPFCTWSGAFTHRSIAGLARHSGQCGIDLDRLGKADATAAIQTAVADAYCLAAFRSARGEGVRLIFRIPPCSPKDHTATFEHVATHVRKIYKHNADTSGKDVSRPSFVSFDNGLWFNPAALVLPIRLPGETQRQKKHTRCVSSTLYAGQLAETWPAWYGKDSASTAPCENGIAKTHESLVQLGLRLAMHAEKTKTPLTERQIRAAFEAWLAELTRLGVRLRGSTDEYWRELLDSVRGVAQKHWFKPAAEFWPRWTRHADFPHDGLPDEKILFAIRQHYCASNSREFFIGVRDAGLVAGVGHVTAWRMLCKLCNSGHLKKIGTRNQPRHAQTYRLEIL